MRKIMIFLLILIWPFMVKAHGMDAMEYFELGIKSTMTGKKINYFSKALELNPLLTQAYEKRGMLYFFQEKYELMIKDFKRFMELEAPNAKDLQMLGIGYLKIGCYAEAITCFTNAIELNPNFAGAYSNRAEAYRFEGKYDQALRDFTTAIHMSADPLILTEAYRNRYKIYWELGQTDKAYSDLKHAWRMDPRVWKIWKLESGDLNYPKYIRKMGLIYLIGIAAGLIFKLKLKPPEKDE